MSPQIHQMQPLAEEATQLLKALAHPARLMICCQIKDSEMSVGKIEATLGIRQPRLSRELAKLREEGLVETRRDAKVVFYRLSSAGRVRAMIDAVCAVMLDAPDLPAATQQLPPPPLRPKRPGGYGVFADTKP